LGAWTGKGRVAVAVPDLTRPLDPTPALAALRARVDGDLVPVVGLGLHRRLRPDEMAPLSRWGAVQHDPDDCVETRVIDGIPGGVARAVADADVVVSVGIAELHQYAGVSGGHKGVSVGCGARQTIAALHARERVLADGVRLGQVEGNSFRAAVDGLGRAARCTLALVWVPAAGVWLAGDPAAVVVEAVQRIDPWLRVDRTWAGAVLRVPPAKAGSLYQASRAATYLGLSPAPPIDDGGTLVLEAACPEGLGSEAGFVAALQRPLEDLLTGPAPSGPGAQRAVMLALLARRYRLVVAGCETPEALRAVGIEAHRGPATTGDDWLVVERPFARLPQRAS
jgi:lactate racemase